MNQTSTVRTDKILDLAGSKVQLVRGGSGDPLLILHDELGPPGWLNFQPFTDVSPYLRIRGQNSWVMAYR